MEARLKAKELVDKMLLHSEFEYDAKQCALIAVDEILSINDERFYQLSGFKETFYKEVKQEIEKCKLGHDR